jgi:hypothetical protein
MNPSLLGLYLIAAEARLPALSVSAPIRASLATLSFAAPADEAETVRNMFRLYLECARSVPRRGTRSPKHPIEGLYLRERLHQGWRSVQRRRAAPIPAKVAPSTPGAPPLAFSTPICL